MLSSEIKNHPISEINNHPGSGFKLRYFNAQRRSPTSEVCRNGVIRSPLNVSCLTLQCPFVFRTKYVHYMLRLGVKTLHGLAGHKIKI